ncbi:MAG: transcription termination factor NusA [Thermodesulfobacteriota bacterium]
MASELKRIIDQISRDKGFDRDILVEALEAAVLSAAQKSFGQRRDLDVRFNEELGEIELFQFRTVVDEVEDEQTEVAITEALELDPEVEMGDELGSKMEDVAELGRIAAQSAKQVIIQKMKDAERDVIFEMYKDRQGDIVNGIVQRFERGNMIVNLGRTDALLPKAEMMPRRSYRQGDRIRALLIEVRETARDHQLILSRTSNEFLIKLFAMEVPEISEGIVSIISAVREPGGRAKIGVVSSELDVDPVGACVGMKGSRVQNVVQELQGEKIDIVPWSPDPAKYVANALSPALVSMVSVDEEKEALVVVVPDDQLSLAIGRGGQNVRLASKLMGWQIDVKSESRFAKSEEAGFQSLLEVEGMTDRLAETLYDNGIDSAAALAAAELALVAELLKCEEEEASAMVSSAALVAAAQPVSPAEGEEEVAPEETAPAAAEDEGEAAGEPEVAEEEVSGEIVPEPEPEPELEPEVELEPEAVDVTEAEE